MQQRKNRMLNIVLINIMTLTFLISTALLKFDVYSNLLQDIQLRKSTLFMMVGIGVCFNFIFTLVINFNVYKVIHIICDDECDNNNVFKNLTLSLFVGSIFSIISSFLPSNAYILFIGNLLSTIIYIGLTLNNVNKNRLARPNKIKLVVLLLVFGILINIPSLFIEDLL